MTTNLIVRPRHRTASSGPAGGSAKRRDIQGLRAFAVVLVVIDHLTNEPAGGFTGVDMFFVVSGYLITGLLIRDSARAENLPALLVNFYRRRVRRLMPAALLVLVAVVLVAPYFVSEARSHSSRVDASWAAVFLVNWHLIADGTNYFSATQPPSLVQHYWSLSVEEQFYLLWPVALFAIRAAAARVQRRTGRDVRRTAFAALIGGCFVASFVYSLAVTQSAATEAYFSSPARAWELCLGAALVLLTWRPSPVVGTVMTWLGVSGIIASAGVIHEGQGFPAPAGLLPCVAAALVIVGGSGTPARNVLLTNPVAVWIGDISYSVYLVHWPIILLLLARFTSRSPYFYSSTVAAILGFSCAMYYLVERPFVNSRLLLPRDRVRTAPGTARKPILDAERALSGATALSLAFLSVGVYTLWPGNQQERDSRYQQITAALADRPATADNSAAGPRGVTLQTQLRTALTAKTWPALVPTLSAEAQRNDVPSDVLACGFIVLQPTSRCTFGPSSAAQTLYVVGDSTAMSYVEAYRRVIEHMPGWKLRVGAAFGCSFGTAVTRNADPSLTNGCAQHNADVIADITRSHPTHLLVTNAYTASIDDATGKVMTDADWTRSVADEVSKLTGTPQVTIVEPPALGPDLSQCDGPGSVPADCAYDLSSTHLDRAAAEQSLAQSRNWTYVRSEGWMCDLPTLQCPAFVDTVPIKHDEIHLGYAFADFVWPVVAESLQREGVLPGGAAADTGSTG